MPTPARSPRAPLCSDPLCTAHDHAADAAYRRAFDLLNRRDFLRVGALTIGGLALAPYLRAAPAKPAAAARAKAIIQVFLFGGPSHTDTFDPKPAAGPDITGPWRKAIGTNVDGIQINELLPLTARQADKYTIVRGLTHRTNGHETGVYMMQTGTDPSAGLVYPAMGAVIACKMEEAGLLKGKSLPAYMTVPVALGRFSEPGFLGPRYRTFVPGNLSDPLKDDERRRLKNRDRLLAELDAFGHSEKDLFEEADYYHDQAREMVLGETREAFDISKEPEAVRKLYGDTEFGRSCLQARRLVERGVAFVTVNMRGWDTHRDQADRYKKLMPELDRGYSALLADLARSGLLDTTIVTCGGEFGRTPKFMTDPPWNGGRNHYGAAFSWTVAGGGFKGGQVIGATDNRGEKVIERPTAPWDLSASIYQLVGVDPAGTLPHPSGVTAPVVPPPPAAKAAPGAKRSAGGTSDVNVATSGILKEIIKT
ncbi:MAG: DUF1501 domain-containing protein [Opitutaceae bacterium]|jgi:hypothetical protein|nr:DUF1501 domain-containing protein [Opitutaceae bacterium]